MKRTAILLALAVLFLLASVSLRQSQDVALAQSGGDYDLSWSTIDGGGYTFSTGGNYSLGGAIGQPDAGLLTGGDYTLAGGFWGGMGRYKVYLPLVLRENS